MLIELEELREVEELALCGFWSKVASSLAARTNRGLEHEVECDRRRRLDASSRILQVIFLDKLAELLAIVVVNLGIKSITETC